MERLRRNSITYKLPRRKNKCGRRNKAWFIPNSFNKLPHNMLQITRITEMKCKIKEHYTQKILCT